MIEVANTFLKSPVPLSMLTIVLPCVVYSHSDDTIREMTKRMPMCEEELLEVTGVTVPKVKRFGARFLQVLLKHAYDDSNDFGKYIIQSIL